MNTITFSIKRRVATVAVLAAVPALIGLGSATSSQAQTTPTPGMGCETIHWGFFGADRRQVCDGPKQADGTWQRTRTVFTPAHVQPLSCLTLSSGLQCSGGYLVPETTQTQESYVVAPDTVLPDEPGWLPAGTDNIL